jgi:hypothetical protein
MTHTDQMRAVEERVFALRLTMTDVLRIAKVANSTWSRAKSRGYIRARTLGRVEDAVAWYEQQNGPANGTDAPVPGGA